MKIPRLIAAVALAASTVVPAAVAPPAVALSCVGPSQLIADATQVYAGRIVDARDNHVLVNVTEVWKGGPVEEKVWLAVEMADWTQWAAGPGSRIPDGYSSSKTWVFAPSVPGTVGPCIAWSLNGVGKYLRTLRPADPKAPTAEGALHNAGEATPATEPTQSSAWPLVGGSVAGAIALVLVAVLVVRRRSVA